MSGRTGTGTSSRAAYTYLCECGCGRPMPVTAYDYGILSKRGYLLDGAAHDGLSARESVRFVRPPGKRLLAVSSSSSGGVLVVSEKVAERVSRSRKARRGRG